MKVQRFRTAYVLALPPEKGASGSLFEGGRTIPTTVEVQSATASLGDPAPAPFANRNAVVIPWAADVSWDLQMSSAVTMTAGGYTIERHPQGIRSRRVTISGDVVPICRPEEIFQVAMQASAGANTGAPPETAYSPSWRLLVALIRLLEQVQKSQTGILHLYAVDEAFYYEVEPTGLRLTRGGRNRTGARYELSLKAMRSVDRPDYLRERPVVKATAVRTSPFKTALAAVRDARAKIGAALVKGRALTEQVVFGPVADVRNTMAAAIGVAEDVAEELDVYATLVAGVTHAPYDTAMQVKRLVTKGEQAIGECKRATVDWAMREQWGFGADGVISAAATLRPEPGATSGSVQAVESALAQYEAQEAVDRMALAAKVAIMAERPRRQTLPVRAHDTIYTLAAVALGDAARWDELATMARLSPPYVSATGEPGTLKPGDRLVLPIPAAADDPPTGTIQPWGQPGAVVPEDELLFGRDLALDRDGDLAEAPGSRDPAIGLDVATVAGLPALEQNIRIRCATRRGTNLLYPRVGLVPVGARATDSIVAQFTVDTLWQLRADRRVARVENFQIEDGGNALGVSARVVATNGREIEV